MKKVCDGDETLLVADAMTGQEGADMAKMFNGAVGICSTILTKMDGDTRGGAALSVQIVSGAPIKFCRDGGESEKVGAVLSAKNSVENFANGRCFNVG